MKRFHRESNNCYQDVIALILENYNMNSLLIYQGSLNFGYNIEKKYWGNRIVPSRDGNWLDCTIYDSLHSSFGISVEFGKTKDIEELANIIKSVRPISGVIVEVDIYNCEWHDLSKKYHNPHYCWVIDCDKEFLKCVLPYGDEFGFYRISDLKINKFISYQICTIGEKIKEPTINDILTQSVYNCKIGFNGDTDIDQMEKMKNTLLREHIYLKEEKGNINDIFAIPLVRALEWIVWSRINYMDLLVYMDKKRQIKSIINSLKESIDIWSGIKNYIIRSILKEKEIIDNEIIEHVDRAIENEKNLLSLMSGMVNGNDM